MRAQTVPVEMPVEQRLLLRSDMEVCLAGAREDLQTPQRLEDPEKKAREAAAFERLIEALRRGSIKLPDEEARILLREVADGVIEGMDWAKEKPSHDAKEAMLRILMPSRAYGEREETTVLEGDLEIERVVLLHVIDVHPAPLTRSELIRELGEEGPSFAEVDAIERSIHGLAALGLLHHRDGFLTPTRAALRFAELLEQ